MDSPNNNRNPLGLSCCRSISDPSAFLKLASDNLLAHNLSASRLSETSSCQSMYRISDETSEPCSSSCIMDTPSPRHITLAKGLLNEAYSYFGNGDGAYFGHADVSCFAPAGPPGVPVPPHLLHIAQEQKSRRRSQDSTLGPLMALLQETQDPTKAACCLKALSFLLLDQANRMDLHQICGLDILLDVLERYGLCAGAIASSVRFARPSSAGAGPATSSLAVQIAALSAIVSLASQDDEAKIYLWSHRKSCAIFDLLSPKLPAPQLLEILDMVASLAFTGTSRRFNRTSSSSSSGNGRRSGGSTSKKGGRGAAGAGGSAQALLEPRLVSAVARLLHPTADREILHQALILLNAAALSKPQPAAAAAAPNWNAPLFYLVPLLLPEQQQLDFGAGLGAGAADVASSSCGAGGCGGEDCSVLEAALKLLLNLSDQPRLCNALFAAGCVAPLLPLLTHSCTTVRVSAACVVANLVEHELSRRQLSRDRELSYLVELLKGMKCSEVTVGLIYVLGRLVALGSPSAAVGHRLRKLGVPALLRRQAAAHREDQDLVLGAAQLLQLLGSPKSPLSPPQQQPQAASPTPRVC